MRMPLFPTLPKASLPTTTTTKQSSRSLRKPTTQQTKARQRLFVQGAVIVSACIFFAANLFFFWHVLRSAPGKVGGGGEGNNNAPQNSLSAFGGGFGNVADWKASGTKNDIHVSASDTSNPTTSTTCQATFRAYPNKRYYNIHDAHPPTFLTDETTYVYGKWPVVLPTTLSSHSPDASRGGGGGSGNGNAAAKMCVDQKAWNKAPPGTLPFADGTNPSIVSLDRYRQEWEQTTASHPSRQAHAATWRTESDAFLSNMPSSVKWLATACMTNSQCHWETDTDEDMKKLGINPQEKPDAVLTVILLLDENFRTVAQTTLTLTRDAAFGKTLKQQQRWKALPEKDNAKKFKEQAMAFDDARLFVHAGQLWISYREGKAFGYDAQVLNPVHLTWHTDTSALTATTRASETTLVCCGRNMALLQQQNTLDQLHALTWVDPITVVEVDTRPWLIQQPPDEQQQAANKQQQGKRMMGRRRLSEEMGSHSVQQQAATTSNDNLQNDLLNHRRLNNNKEGKHSHVHGTNAFMVPFPDPSHPGSFLGVGHFHRPNDREKNPYARFGHHYTHTFFTVAPVRNTTSRTVPGGGSDGPVYELTAMSSEFVLPAAVDQTPPDAEVIQFLSGLEISGDHLVIAYGINDCEAAVTTVSLETLHCILQPVQHGEQVMDLMQPWDGKEAKIPDKPQD